MLLYIGRDNNLASIIFKQKRFMKEMDFVDGLGEVKILNTKGYEFYFLGDRFIVYKNKELINTFNILMEIEKNIKDNEDLNKVLGYNEIPPYTSELLLQKIRRMKFSYKGISHDLKIDNQNNLIMVSEAKEEVAVTSYEEYLHLCEKDYQDNMILHTLNRDTSYVDIILNTMDKQFKYNWNSAEKEKFLMDIAELMGESFHQSIHLLTQQTLDLYLKPKNRIELNHYFKLYAFRL